MPVTTALPRGLAVGEEWEESRVIKPRSPSPTLSFPAAFTESLKLSSRGGARGELGALGLGAKPATPEMCG